MVKLPLMTVKYLLFMPHQHLHIIIIIIIYDKIIVVIEKKITFLANSYKEDFNKTKIIPKFLELVKIV